MGVDPGEQVQQQYATNDVWARIEEAIRAAGLDPRHLSLEDLAPLEEFHIGGRQASLELAVMASFAPASRVLDVGAGLGGPARLLAARFGCLATALDLTEEYCRAAQMLNEATGLADRVTVRQGDALALPFPDGGFDGVWTQHASMNIEDKARFYTEMRRVLPVGGTLALHDVHAGPVQPIVFPVPWADTSSLSFLATPEEAQSLITSAGFDMVVWRDRTAQAIEFFRGWEARSQRPELGVHIYVPDLATKSRNQVENFETNRLRVTQAIFRAI